MVTQKQKRVTILLLRFEQKELFLGLRSPKKRCLQSVNEHLRASVTTKEPFVYLFIYVIIDDIKIEYPYQPVRIFYFYIQITARITQP